MLTNPFQPFGKPYVLARYINLFVCPNMGLFLHKGIPTWAFSFGFPSRSIKGAHQEGRTLGDPSCPNRVKRQAPELMPPSPRQVSETVDNKKQLGSDCELASLPGVSLCKNSLPYKRSAEMATQKLARGGSVWFPVQRHKRNPKVFTSSAQAHTHTHPLWVASMAGSKGCAEPRRR